MMIIATTILLLFIIKSLVYLLSIVLNRGVVTVKRNSRKHINKVAVIIPVYKEEKIIKNTIEYFKGIKADVYYVSTIREGKRTKNSTYQLIRESVVGGKALFYGGGQAKSGQINQALRHLYSLDKYSYIGIFDADSRPDKNVFEYIRSNQLNADILQMPSRYYDNYTTISLLNKANAVFQTRWSLCYELPQWRKWQTKKSYAPLMYLVGHGLFISAERKFYFPEDTIAEDLYFGYSMSLDNNSIFVLPFFDNCTVPEKYTLNIIQSSRWFYGELILPKIMTKYKLTVNRLIAFVVRYTQILQWMLGPIMVLICVIYSFTTFSIWLMVLSMLGIVIYCVALPTLSVTRTMRLNVFFYLAYILKSIINCMGPLLCVYKQLLHKNEIFIKTER